MVEECNFSVAPVSRRMCPLILVLTGVFIMTGGTSGALGADTQTQGKVLAMEKSKGNCLACHVIADGVQPGNIGPPLVAMKARFPDAENLFQQIWDATQANPETRMPPFGRHGILSREEIELIIEYLYSL